MTKIIPIILSMLSICSYGQFSNEHVISHKIRGGTTLEVVDLNNDGYPEIVVGAANSQEKIHIHWNQGNSSVNTVQDLAGTLSGGINDIASLDLNQDGWNDLVISTEDGVFLIKNNQDSTFQKTLISGTTAAYHFIDTSDVDLDGDVDVLIGKATGDIVELFENINDTLYAQGSGGVVTMDNCFSGLTAYLDNDSLADIVTSSWVYDSVYYMTNNGNAVFDTAMLVGALDNATKLDIADVNGDGFNDIIGVSLVEGVLAAFINDGNQIFTKFIIASNSISKTFELVDYNGDQYIDILFQPSSNEYFEVLINDGLGSFSSSDTIFCVGQQLIVDFNYSDISNDGINEINTVINNNATNNTTICSFQQNMGVWGPIYWSFSPFGFEGVEFIDLDADNDMDVVASSSGRLYIWEQISTDHFHARKTMDFGVPASPLYLSNIDLDGDLDKDLICNLDQDTMIWIRNDSSFFNSNVRKKIGYQNQRPYGFDYDQDGWNDVLGNNGYWFKNLGNGTFNQIPYSLITGVSGSQCFCDFDNDGDLDYPGEQNASSNFGWYKNDGTGLYSFQWLMGISGSPSTVSYCYDLNSDGLSDIIVASYGVPNQIYWLRNLGSGNFDMPELLATTYGILYITDIDLDLDPDIFYYDNTSSSTNIGWIENNGGSFIDHSSTTSLSVSMGRTIDTDFDGDADFALALSSPGERYLVLHKNTFVNDLQISGQCFYDQNQNGIRDSLEIGLPNISTNLSPLSTQSFTNTMGKYYYAIDSGNFVLSYDSLNYWNRTTDSSQFHITITSSTPISSGNDFGFYPDSIFSSADVDITSGPNRCNSSPILYGSIKNSGTTILAGIVDIKIDPLVSFSPFGSVYYDSTMGQNLYWSFDSLLFGQYLDFKSSINIPGVGNIGDTLKYTIQVSLLDSIGNVYSTLHDTTEKIISCAYDPNIKEVYPIGQDSLGYIPKYTNLEYTVHFQNTGSDTAQNVTIIDQLSGNLNWESLDLISFSDPVIINVDSVGVLTALFENIFLPDSGANYAESQGYFKYKIQVDSQLVEGTQIENTAKIYFDYNPAIVTNTTINTIECPAPNISNVNGDLVCDLSGNLQWYLNDTLMTGETNNILQTNSNFSGEYYVIIDYGLCQVQSNLISGYTYINKNSQIRFEVLPNPTNNYFDIVFNKSMSNAEVSLFDATGRLITKKTVSTSSARIYKEETGSGLFSLVIITADGKKYVKKVLVL